MATTKREIVEQAYGELSLQGYVFDLSPEEFLDALKRLDRLMASLDMVIALGYNLPANPNDTDPDDDSGLPDWAVDPVATNLAVRLAPGNGKNLSQDTRIAAKNGLNMLLARTAQIPRTQYPDNLPMGTGNKRLPNDRQYFTNHDSVTVTPNGQDLNLTDCTPPQN